MLMNENSELRSFVSCSKNFSKNIINKSIKNNIVPINNDVDVKSKCNHRGFILSTFGVTLSDIKFSLFTKTAFLINSLTNIIFSIPINIVTLSHINFLYTFSFSSSFVALYTLFTLSSFMSSLSQSLILSLIFVCTFSLSSSLTALAAPFLLSSFVLPIIVLLKSPTAFL